MVEQFGPTKFIGYRTLEGEARVLAVLDAEKEGQVEIFLDRTPFYAEAGGQVGDTGSVSTSTGRAQVLDTTAALPGLHRHLAVIEDGFISPGQEARTGVDAERRAAIRRNHTGTHLLHWALREVLGQHVKQHGSLVAPDRLRFDFTHYAPVTRAELDEVEDLVNTEILADMAVVTEEMPRAEAEAKGAIAFFGDKYGERVQGGARRRQFRRAVRWHPRRAPGDDRSGRDRLRELDRVQPAPGGGVDGDRHARALADQRGPPGSCRHAAQVDARRPRHSHRTASG